MAEALTGQRAETGAGGAARPGPADRPFVSVCIASAHRPALLSRCLESLASPGSPTELRAAGRRSRRSVGGGDRLGAVPAGERAPGPAREPGRPAQLPARIGARRVAAVPRRRPRAGAALPAHARGAGRGAPRCRRARRADAGSPRQLPIPGRPGRGAGVAARDRAGAAPLRRPCGAPRRRGLVHALRARGAPRGDGRVRRAARLRGGERAARGAAARRGADALRAVVADLSRAAPDLEGVRRRRCTGTGGAGVS